MIRLVYIFLLTGIFCLPELLLRNLGLFFPFCALFVFYTAIAFGPGWGTVTAVLGALTLDGIGSGASHPWSLLIFGAVIGFSVFWMRQAESDSVMMNFLPGLVIPPLVWGLSVIFFAQHPFAAALEQFPIIFPAAAFSAVILPLMILLLDRLNARLALPLFIDARQKRKRGLL